MTGKTFRLQVLGSIFVLLALSALTLWAGVRWEHREEARAILPVYIAAAAAWLTFCLQRRVAYTNALRSLWEKIVKTIQEGVQYTHKASATEADFSALMRELSSRIDEVRSVFRNVGERYEPPSPQAHDFVLAVRAVVHPKNKSGTVSDLGPPNATFRPQSKAARDQIGGVYPFESLKQIQAVLAKLGYGPDFTAAGAVTARQTVQLLWGVLRAELLKELDRDYPEFPDTPYPRRWAGGRLTP